MLPFKDLALSLAPPGHNRSLWSLFSIVKQKAMDRKEITRFGGVAELCSDQGEGYAFALFPCVYRSRPIGQSKENDMTTKALNIYAPIAANLAASAISLIETSRATDAASTPFARNAFAAIVGGLSSLAMTASLVIASAGSPKGANGKVIKNVSGLRNVEGGTRVYQAWKEIELIASNIDADEWLVMPDPDAETDDGKAGQPGARVIRPAVVAFILNDADAAHKALFGKTGIASFVRDAMTEHGKALAALHGVEADESDKEEGKEGDTPQTLSERVASMLVALQASDDAAFVEASTALASLSDYIDSRWAAIADATAPEQGEAGLADAAETLAPLALADAA